MRCKQLRAQLSLEDSWKKFFSDGQLVYFRQTMAETRTVAIKRRIGGFSMSPRSLLG